MAFTFSQTGISENRIVFVYEECAFPGVLKVAGKVREDIAKVFGAKPVGVEYAVFGDTASFFSYPVFFGTVGNSGILDKLAAKGAIDLFKIAGESEAYSLTVVDGAELDGFSFESALVIAGSDKRGTIYGLFALSGMLGVSPLVNWLDVVPARMDERTFTGEDSYVSKTPSVKYRGFFINDEWPAFGNWCEENFGGFNSKAYEAVFELLLRLKGNYLWPAMWSAVFSDDGPGLKNCELADEYGIIMGTSHHEPCMRQGEEYSRLRGPKSQYGDDWNFITNRDGIIKFWEDGLSKRSQFENIYTVGMRGEADTAIMKDKSLGDNIALLKDVIRTQNGLIASATGKDAKDTPRLLTLYKEVEPIFWGDDKTAGLKDDPELDGITLMLCDDNFGNLRSMPPEGQAERPGGWGMYYHLDYHGAPVSYEWFNTSSLSKIWEQMTTAYDFGIRQVWMVNVGDIFTNEYPLSFFMDLAYDFDRWGTSDKNSAVKYTEEFVAKNFPFFTDGEREETVSLLLGYTKITARRRTEAMNDRVYAPFTFSECERMLGEIDSLTGIADKLLKDSKKDDGSAFYELVYVPLKGNLNVQKMWLLTTLNHAYADMGSTYCLSLAKDIKECIEEDKKLVDRLHSAHKGKWYGMGMSEHIGFRHWCEEECRRPVIHTLEPSEKPRLIVSVPETGEYTEGGSWTGKTLVLPSALNPQKCGGYIEITGASSAKVPYDITTDAPFIDIMECKKSIRCGRRHRVFIFVDRMKLEGSASAVGNVFVSYEDRVIRIAVPVNNPDIPDEMPANTFISCGEGYVAIDAADFAKKTDTESGSFEIIPGFGRGSSAIKAYPQNRTFTRLNAPTALYNVMLEEGGRYNVRIYTSPANPTVFGGKIVFAVSAGSDPVEVSMIPDGFEIGDGKSIWEQGVLDNIRTKDVTLELRKGLNELKISALSPGFVLEKIVITPETVALPYSYLGPVETYHT